VLPYERPAAVAIWLSGARAASSERFHGADTEIRVAKLPASFSGGCADWLSKAAVSTRHSWPTHESGRGPGSGSDGGTARRHGSAAAAPPRQPKIFMRLARLALLSLGVGRRRHKSGIGATRSFLATLTRVLSFMHARSCAPVARRIRLRQSVGSGNLHCRLSAAA
jgi:hypothetical protein